MGDDEGTILLYFFNDVFDDIVVVSIFNRDKIDDDWSGPKTSDFAVFYASELHNDYFYGRNYVLYIELPIDNNSIYLSSIWESSNGGIFDIYYDDEYIRFYKVENGVDRK